MTLLTFLFYLIIAAACAGIAEALVPGRIPGGFFATAVVGILGAWIGSTLTGNIGPTLGGVPLLSTILGSAILVFVFALLKRQAVM